MSAERGRGGENNQLVTNPKSVPSKKLRDDLNITQRKE